MNIYSILISEMLFGCLMLKAQRFSVQCGVYQHGLRHLPTAGIQLLSDFNIKTDVNILYLFIYAHFIAKITLKFKTQLGVQKCSLPSSDLLVFCQMSKPGSCFFGFITMILEQHINEKSHTFSLRTSSSTKSARSYTLV